MFASVAGADVRMKYLHLLVGLLSSVEGDIVECGVSSGDSAEIIINALIAFDQKKEVWLYDNYGSMVEPGEEDRSVRKCNEDPHKKWERMKGEWHNHSLDSVKSRLLPMGYDRLRFVEGKVEDTIPFNMPEKISLLHLDTDWYSSTKHEMEHLYPLVVNKGVIIFDDYGYYTGCKKADDEFVDPGKLIVLNANARMLIK